MQTPPRWAKRLVLAALTFLVVSTLAFYPWATDNQASAADTEAQRQFYAKAFAATRNLNTAGQSTGAVALDEYSRRAVALHVLEGSKPKLAGFLAERGITNGRGLDVGSGSGFFQDVMADYTGLDISTSAARFYKKGLVLGSATALPFHDNEFDIVFSFYALEHIPNPEQALREIRRVVKSGGYVYLQPAWNCSPFLSQGYPVRPYSDFGFGGKFLKAIQPVVESSILRATGVIPARLIRLAVASTMGPTKFHYSRLTPNYETYWMSDSDAVNSLGRQEMALWFTSRGDECVNCERPAVLMTCTRPSDRRLIVHVKK